MFGLLAFLFECWLGFFGLWRCFCVCFDAVYVFLVGGFAFYVNAHSHLFGLLLVYACFFEFVGAKALADALFAVLFCYDYFKVMHYLPPLTWWSPWRPVLPVLRLGRAFSEPLPRWWSPLTFLPALVMLRNTRPFNILGLPTISLNCGCSKSGLPIGLQITGAPGAEGAVLALAHVYQKQSDWHKQRPHLD